MHYDKIEACLNTAKIEINQSEKIENDLIKEYKELNVCCSSTITNFNLFQRKNERKIF